MTADQFDDYWTSALVYACAARVAAHRADFEQARDLVRRAALLRPLLTHALPIVSAQALLQLAHAYLAVADPDGVPAALRQLKDLQHHRPGLGNLPPRPTSSARRSTCPRGDVIGVASLTTAELRLLPLLPTHLTLVEISERLFVSRNTVKSQAISVYRKLGVSSRSETVARMHELGLLATTWHRPGSPVLVDAVGSPAAAQLACRSPRPDLRRCDRRLSPAAGSASFDPRSLCPE